MYTFGFGVVGAGAGAGDAHGGAGVAQGGAGVAHGGAGVAHGGAGVLQPQSAIVAGTRPYFQAENSIEWLWKAERFNAKGPISGEKILTIE